jgi:iron complex transport system substrate-binding protein
MASLSPRGRLTLPLILLLLAPGVFASEYRDALGRTLRLDRKPRRIIALGPGAMRLVAYLGAADLVVATENIEIKYPKGRPYTAANLERLRGLPVISEGGPDKVPDYEKIIAAAPDLIIACSIDGQLLQAVESKTGIKVFSADYGNLGTFRVERFKQVLSTLGAILGKEERAAFLVRRVDEHGKDLRRRASAAKSRPSVYVGGLGFKGGHGITSTQYAYEPFRLLGIKSVIDRGSRGPLHVFIDQEALLKADPDVIFMDAGGLRVLADDLSAHGGFYPLLRAFRNRAVYTTLPYNYYTTNVEIVFINAYFIGRVLYPKEFADVEVERKARELLKEFVGRDVYDDFMEEKNYYKRLSIGGGIAFERMP